MDRTIKRFLALAAMTLSMPAFGEEALAEEMAGEMTVEMAEKAIEETVEQVTQEPVVEDAPEPQAARSDVQLADLPRGVIRLDETVISGNQELPKVLYILPWREPQGLPEIEIQAEFTEAEVFRRLYPPAYRRELGYFETLDGLRENTGPKEE